MKIVTWNTNGFFNEEGRLKVLSTISEDYKIGNESNTIFCLQEAGTSQALNNLYEIQLGTILYSVIHYIPYQTEVSRCCLAFLVPKSIVSCFNSFAFDSAQESRPIACLQNKKSGFTIANIHATPHLFDDTVAARDVITTMQELKKKYYKGWALFGDMNCEPDRLEKCLNDNIKQWRAIYTIFHPNNFTHISRNKSKKVLDYSITGSRYKIDIFFEDVRLFQASDHRPVVFSITDSVVLGNK